MLVQSKRSGQLYEAHTWKSQGPQFCSECGDKLSEAGYYTRHQVYHPFTKQAAYITKCSRCFPIEEVQQPSQPIPIDYKDTQEVQIVRANGVSARIGGWTREKPAHIDEVLTEVLPTPRGLGEKIRKALHQ